MRSNMMVLAAVTGLAIAQSATAAISYRYMTESSGYTIPAGGTTTVKVYLEETSPIDSMIISHGGLAGAAFQLFTNDSGVTILSATAGPGLELAEGAVAIGGLRADPTLTDDLKVPGAPMPTRVGETDVWRLELAEIVLQQSVPGSSASFRLSGSGYSNSTITSLDPSLDLDLTQTTGLAYTGTNAAGPFDFTVAVPEPTILSSLLAVAGCVALRRRR